ncbi:chemotaxis protein CheB [Magnetospira thiophila]
MPANSGAAFVVVQHLDPKHASMLPELLDKATEMSVVEIVDGVPLAPNTVYVIPPAQELTILHGVLHLIDMPDRHGIQHPIDNFLRSLALDQREQATCIILSGAGSEGAAGLRAIKAEAGVVLVQQPETAKFDSMPRAAIDTHLVDFVLPPEDMPKKLLELWSFPRVARASLSSAEDVVIDEATLAKVVALVRQQTSHDFSDYKPSTLLRRVERRMKLHQIERPADYVRFLSQHVAERTTLFKELLIGVTAFFRDRAAFDVVAETVVPKIFDNLLRDDELRVWVVGCSTGEEAYSLAILLTEEMERRRANIKIQVFGTDLDGEAIEKARGGLFPPSIATDLPPRYLERYFTSENSGFRVRDSIRSKLVFAEQNITKDPPFSRIDLICCRNLLIYMGAKLQARLMPLFHYALKPGGFLFLGSSETIGDFNTLFAVIDRKAKIYQRRMNGDGQTLAPSRVIPSMEVNPPLAPVSEARHEQPTDLRTWLQKTTLAEYAPPCVVINRKMDIVFIQGHTGKYLEPAPGETTANIQAMARPGLAIELPTAIRKALTTGEEVLYEGLKIQTNGGFQLIDLLVRPINEPLPLAGLILIVFKEVRLPPQRKARKSSKSSESRTAELERELRNTREYLQTTVEEMETSNEELKSTNEELQSSNEELQSINEEHVTSKEELQSVNEELATVNAELESKVSDLTKINNDMTNLLAATQVGTLFLDQNLCITLFTPAATEVINLINGDVGRPLGHIVTNLEKADLVKDAKLVLDTLVTLEREITAKDDKRYLVRILPYRTMDNVIDGVVMTFTDVTKLRLLEHEARLAAVVRNSSDAVTLMDLNGKILAWNHAAERLYGQSEQQAINSNIREFIPKEHQQDLDRFFKRIHSGAEIPPFEALRQRADGTHFGVIVTATLLRDAQDQPWAITATERQKRAE